MTEQLVTLEVRLAPPSGVRWYPNDAGLVGRIRGRASSVVLLVIYGEPFYIVWVTCTSYAARETRRQVYTEVEPIDGIICAVCTALELLKAVGDEPAEVN